MKKVLIASLVTCTVLTTPVFAGELVGGWKSTADPSVTAQAQDAFDKAMDGYPDTDTEYETVDLLATQVVAGTNYCFLCQSVENEITGYALVYVYENLSGNAEILGIKDIAFGEGILEEEE